MKKNNLKPIIVTVVLILVIIGVMVGYFIIKNYQKEVSEKNETSGHENNYSSVEFKAYYKEPNKENILLNECERHRLIW